MADLCKFDSTLSTFDSTVRRWDETTCASVTPPVTQPSFAPGAGGLGYFRTKKGKRRFNDFFADIVDEVKREMAMEQARAELSEMVARKGAVARKDLEEALELMREQRKRRRRRAAAIMLLDS